jgi:hypothetical protein
MAVPDVIPLGYERGYHTDRIGHWDGGQVRCSVVAAFREGYIHTDDWLTHKRALCGREIRRGPVAWCGRGCGAARNATHPGG